MAINVLPVNRVLLMGRPPAVVSDDQPLVNLTTFGLCSSPANPSVAAATAAALGVLTPMPCVPAIVSPLAPPVATVLIGGQPAAGGPAQCQCAWAGLVEAQSTPGTVALG